MNAFPDMTIPAFLDRRSASGGQAEKPLVYTYTNLNTYENICPHQMYRRYVKKDMPFVGSPDTEHGNAGHTALELRLGGKPLPQPLETMEPVAASLTARRAVAEQQMGLTVDGKVTGFFDKNVWYRGKIDAHIVQGTVAYIGDFKFGKTMREDPLELELNAVMIHARYPHLTKFVGQYLWGPDRYGTRQSFVAGPMHPLDTGNGWRTMRRIAAAIENDRKADEFEKRKSGLCGWCPVEDCQHNTLKQRLAREGKS